MVVRTLAGAAVATVALFLPALPATAQAYPGGTNNERSPGNVAGTGGSIDGAQVKGVTLVRGEALPVTGSDAVQLTVLGAGLVAGGVVLVKRSRRQAPAATA